MNTYKIKILDGPAAKTITADRFEFHLGNATFYIQKGLIDELVAAFSDVVAVEKNIRE